MDVKRRSEKKNEVNYCAKEARASLTGSLNLTINSISHAFNLNNNNTKFYS